MTSSGLDGRKGPYRIGLVVPALDTAGGVGSVAEFLCEVISDSETFDFRLFSVPSSSRDPSSVRLISPYTWCRGIEVEEGMWKGYPFEGVGSIGAELEFQRYRARGALTRRLEECDLIQIVAGSPAWTLVATEVQCPVALQVATMTAVEREERLKRESGLVSIWRRLMTAITARLDRSGLKVADCIFVENTWMKETAESWTEPGKVILAPPGVDTDHFRPSCALVRSETGHILSVGRFDDRRKRVGLLFEAYARLCQRDDEPPMLVLAGRSGPRPEDWRIARKLGIRDRVHFHEKVHRSRLAELYREASLFVLSSAEEGLGIVLLEAMASALPVVSTATEGAKEAVEDGATGILAPIGDAEALSQAMERLLGDSRLRLTMGRKGRSRAERFYSRAAAGRRFLRQYRKLLGINEP